MTVFYQETEFIKLRWNKDDDDESRFCDGLDVTTILVMVSSFWMADFVVGFAKPVDILDSRLGCLVVGWVSVILNDLRLSIERFFVRAGFSS